MKKTWAIAATLTAAAGAAQAGGIERSDQSVGILFEEGNYAEFSLGLVNPSVSGVDALGSTLNSGDMASSYSNLSFGYKRTLSDTLDAALIVEQSGGVDVAYPVVVGYPFSGATADVEVYSITALLRQEMSPNFSLYGGLRAQSAKGEVAIPTLGGYTLTTGTDYALGYVLGAAYERPDIALRVALTYNSAITHGLTGSESFSPTPTSFETEIPQSVNLEFQSGIAADTLLFGSIRWQEWSEFDISPPAFTGVFGPLADITEDTITYNLGIGRRFNDTWSGAILLSHEPSTDDSVGPVGDVGNLGPTDGFSSIGVAATYTTGNIEVTGGVRYIWIGDATTRIGAVFEDNDAIAAGVRIGYRF